MAGRPKRTFSDEQVQEIERLALMNCQNNTIAVALNIPLMTLKRYFGKKIIHWRAKYKTNLRENQSNLSKTSSEMAKFLGKNVFNQTDKQVIENKPATQQLNETEVQAVKDLARQYNLKLAKGHQEAV